MPPNTPQMPRVEALDLLRLVAVLGVVLYHFGFWGPGASGIPAIPWLTPVAKYGFLGVPAFFVISGFVIAYSAEGRTAVGFAIARFSRIYPTFVFCMTLTFLATRMWGPPHFEASLSQWFANLDDIKEDALKALETVMFYPQICARFMSYFVDDWAELSFY